MSGEPLRGPSMIFFSEGVMVKNFFFGGGEQGGGVKGRGWGYVLFGLGMEL